MITRLCMIKNNLNLKTFQFIKPKIQFVNFSTKLPLLKNKEETKKYRTSEATKESENYWPHPLAIFASLTILYGLWWALGVQYRAGKKYSESKGLLDEKQSIISSKNPKIVLTLGSPHLKKDKIIDELISKGFYLIQTSQLFTEELNNPNSIHFEEISRALRENSSISVKTTLDLIRDAMIDVLDSKNKFLIDGFPQQMDQLRKFEGSVHDPTLALYFDCPSDELVSELAAKSDNKDSEAQIQKKLHNYQFTAYPIVQYFMRKDQALVINSNDDLNFNIDKILKKLNQLI